MECSWSGSSVEECGCTCLCGSVSLCLCGSVSLCLCVSVPAAAVRGREFKGNRRVTCPAANSGQLLDVYKKLGGKSDTPSVFLGMYKKRARKSCTQAWFVTPSLYTGMVQ